MEAIREFFIINRVIVLFIYGLAFFVMGLAIFLQSRRYSRLPLARDLGWLAAFGITHGINEWGDIFIPIQSEYMSAATINFLETIHVLLRSISFVSLMMFGAAMLQRRYPWLKRFVIIAGLVWLTVFVVSAYVVPRFHDRLLLANIWSRYLLALPGSLLAAYGLREQARSSLLPLHMSGLYRILKLAGLILVTYAFFGGLIVPRADFFPANVLNYHLMEELIGIPVQVVRTTIGFILTIVIIRVLEVFEIDLDHLIERMEVEQIQQAERERIGQEIHDGAIQGVYSASLILESMEALVQTNHELARRLQQAQSVLNAVNMDLRNYMVSLRAVSPPDPLIDSLKHLISDPRFQGLVQIDLNYSFEPALKPMQIYHVLAIVQESLSNIVRHARARHAAISIEREKKALRITIEDDGRGFSTESGLVSYGLRSMRDRARLLGGALEIESIIGRGTTVILTLPEEKTDGYTENHIGRRS